MLVIVLGNRDSGLGIWGGREPASAAAHHFRHAKGNSRSCRWSRPHSRSLRERKRRSSENLCQKTGPVFQRTDTEQFGDRLADVSERRPDAKVRPPTNGPAGDKQRNVLTRMIRTRRRRVVAVIGSHHQHIPVGEARQQLSEASVESLEVGGVTRSVVAVSEQRVEINE